jgi:hypothetical protein
MSKTKIWYEAEAAAQSNSIAWGKVSAQQLRSLLNAMIDRIADEYQCAIRAHIEMLDDLPEEETIELDSVIGSLCRDIAMFDELDEPS